MITNYRPHMLPKVRSDKLMASAAGMPCTLRIASFIPGLRCSGPETTVMAHLPIWGKGIGTKVTDIGAAFGCDVCHRILDQPGSEEARYIEQHYRAAMMHRLLCGLTETLTILMDEGIIEIPGAAMIDCGNWK